MDKLAKTQESMISFLKNKKKKIIEIKYPGYKLYKTVRNNCLKNTSKALRSEDRTVDAWLRCVSYRSQLSFFQRVANAVYSR